MKIIILFAALAVVSTNSVYRTPVHPVSRYSTSDYLPQIPTYPTQPAYQTVYQPEYYPAQPYSFEWAVNDVASDNDYTHSESSDGKMATGSYRILLPDGRTQVVTYKADSYGYVADVNYEGEAKYAEYKPSVSYSAPAYKVPVAPAYRAPETVSYKAPPRPLMYRATAPTY